MINQILQRLRRLIKPKPLWFEEISVTPVSGKFGFDRGTPIDRYYIEDFLFKNNALIKGSVLEIAESTYSKKFGSGVTSFEVLHVDASNPVATIIGDLSVYESLPENAVDCFVCTQTLNFIYDVKQAIRGIHKILKPGGHVLITVAGLVQISRYDMDRWGDYWRFTPLSIQKMVDEVFGESSVSVYGNVYAATALLHGLCVEEITVEKLNYADQDFPVIITILAQKKIR